MGRRVNSTSSWKPLFISQLPSKQTRLLDSTPKIRGLAESLASLRKVKVHRLIVDALRRDGKKWPKETGAPRPKWHQFPRSLVPYLQDKVFAPHAIVPLLGYSSAQARHRWSQYILALLFMSCWNRRLCQPVLSNEGAIYDQDFSGLKDQGPIVAHTSERQGCKLFHAQKVLFVEGKILLKWAQQNSKTCECFNSPST